MSSFINEIMYVFSYVRLYTFAWEKKLYKKTDLLFGLLTLFHTHHSRDGWVERADSKVEHTIYWIRECWMVLYFFVFFFFCIPASQSNYSVFWTTFVESSGPTNDCIKFEKGLSLGGNENCMGKLFPADGFFIICLYEQIWIRLWK